MNKGEWLYLLLGSNLGDRVAILEQTLAELSHHFGAPERVSDIYHTAAWGVTDQPDFLNQVVAFGTTEEPDRILAITQGIEQQAGPPKQRHWGERYLDIDLLFYGSRVLQTPTLTLPHPEIQNRRFTLVPLVEVSPDFVHPTLGQTMTQLLANTSDSLPVYKGLPHEA